MSIATERADGDDARRRLYDLRESDDLSTRTFVRRVLAVGVDRLAGDAYLTRLSGAGSDSNADGDGDPGVDADPDPDADAEGVHEVVVAGDGPLVTEGMTYERDAALCGRTVGNGVPLAVADATERGDRAALPGTNRDAGRYLGATVRVDGEPFGTVCFVGREPRREPFSPGERSFVELVAASLGRRLSADSNPWEAGGDDSRTRSERKYEAVLRAAPDAVVLIDAASAAVVDANDAASDLLGAAAGDLVGRDAAEFVPPDDRGALAALFEHLETSDGPTTARSRTPDGSPIEVLTADGRTVPVEISAASVDLDGDRYVQVILRDVSRRRERERELRLKDRAIEEASIGVTIAELDGDDAAPLRYVNREFERLTGYDREEILGRDAQVLQGDATGSGSVAAVGTAIEDREPHTTELLNYRTDGTPFWNELTVAPVENDAGAVTHYVGFQQDVTDRKRRERQVSVLNRVLRHNVRNRTNVIGGFARMLADGDRTDADTTDLAERIADAAADLANLSEMARSVERVVREPGESRPRDVARVVRDVAADLRDHRDARVTVTAPGTVRALATPHLRTALSELGENALEHGAPPVEFRVEPAEEALEITVADGGPGLPPDERTLVEDGRETPVEHGEGLGLWLVNRVVTDAGGRVSVDADEGGTAVTIRLATPASDG